MDRVAEGSAAILVHFGVAAQNMLVFGAGCVGPAGPGCVELPGRWFLLICEEGLVPPINTNSSDKRFRQSIGYKGEEGRGEMEKSVAYLPITRQIDLQGLGVILEAKRRHGKEDILAIDRFALFLLAFFGGWASKSAVVWQLLEVELTLAGYEGDELAHAFLHAFLCLFGYFGVVGQRHFHDARNWSKVTYVSIQGRSRACVLEHQLRWGSGGLRRRGQHGADCKPAVFQAHKDSDWLAANIDIRDSTLRRAIGGRAGIQGCTLEQSVDVQMGAEQRANQSKWKGQGKSTYHWRLEAIDLVP